MKYNTKNFFNILCNFMAYCILLFINDLEYNNIEHLSSIDIMATTKRRTADYYNKGNLPTIFDVFEQLHPGKETITFSKIKAYHEFREYFYCIPIHTLSGEGDHNIYMRRLYNLYENNALVKCNKEILPTLSHVFENHNLEKDITVELLPTPSDVFETPHLTKDITVELLPTLSDVFEKLHPGKGMNVKPYEIKHYCKFMEHFPNIPTSGEYDVRMKHIHHKYVNTCLYGRGPVNVYDKEVLPTLSDVFEHLHSGKDTKIKYYAIKSYDEFIEYFPDISNSEKFYMKMVYRQYVNVALSTATF